MEFISNVLKRKIVLKEDKVCIEINGLLDKFTGVPSVEFRYEEINSIEIFDPKKGLFTFSLPSINFKVNGQEFKGADINNPFKVQFKFRQKEEVRKIKEEIYRRIELKKNDNKSNFSEADELKEITDLKDQEIITEKKQIKVSEEGGCLKGCLLFFGFPILFLLILIPFFSDEEKTFDQGRADVFCGIEIKDTLNNPRSYRFDRSRVIKNTEDPELGKLVIVYRAKNVFGSYVRDVRNCLVYRVNNEIKYKLLD